MDSLELKEDSKLPSFIMGGLSFLFVESLTNALRTLVSKTLK